MEENRRDRRKFNQRRHRSRGGLHGNRFNSDHSGSSSSNSGFRGRGGDRGRCGRPPFLRGKEIGLYYAFLQKRKEKAEIESGRPLGEILLSDSRKSQIKKLLQQIGSNPFTDSQTTSNNTYSDIGESKFKEEFLQIVNGTIEEKLNNTSAHKTLERNRILDIKYLDEFNEKQSNNIQYKSMLNTRFKLPSFDKRREILELIDENQVIVISGETGCGKTTQVAQFILDEYIMLDKGSICKVVCTQPRRISAISVAERVAQERGEQCGQASVGYQIRLERKLPRATGSIAFCTTGVLLKQMESDPYLSDISHLILDEIHERDVISDFIITLLKQIISRRSDLKLILMSATLNAEQFCTYYNNCASINIPGFTFPVQSYYLEDVLARINFFFERPRDSRTNYVKRNKSKQCKIDEFLGFIEPYVRSLRNKRSYSNKVCDSLLNPDSEELNMVLIAKLIEHICAQKEEGAILVFVPGFSDISALNTELIKSNSFPPSKYIIVLLHSKMPSIQQRKVFDKPPKGIRKIVIATNIAETSITIDDIVFVIDCGKIKMKTYDVENDIESLKPEWVSLANAKQRQGRAGRVQAGVCFHLFSRAREMCLESYQQPEIQRSRLENIILTVKILQLGNTETFLNQLMNPPLPLAIENALNLLRRINALDNEERLTPLGYHLAKLPVNPRMGKMILMGALFSCLDPILSIAASLDFKDAFQIPINKQREVDEKKRELLDGWNSDHLVLAEALKLYNIAKTNHSERKFCWEYFLSSHTLELLNDMKNQFAEYLCGMNFLTNNDVKSREWNQNSNNLSLIKAIVCAGLYPNVAIIRKVNRHRKRITTLEHERVDLHPSSVNAKELSFASPFLVYHLKMKSKVIYLHDSTMVHPLPLVFFGDEINIEMNEGHTVISLSNILRFKCSESTALLIKDLRKQLDNLLKYKISHPGTINWMTNNTEVSVLRAIMELITSEDMGEMQCDEEGSDFSDN